MGGGVGWSGELVCVWGGCFGCISCCWRAESMVLVVLVALGKV